MESNRNKPIYVTQPFLPPLEEFTPYLEKIWESNQLTNKGPLHQQLEKELCDYLDVKYVSLLCNGTIALLIAIKALGLKDEIITTPYSFIATAHSIKWNGLCPVFIDIEPSYCNLNVDKIEEAITEKTSAILPVHVYGNPCNTENISTIANKYNLKVIYDAAHAFGVKKNGRSILNEGDLSVLSFHATKVFNTFEGGAIVSHTKEMKKKVDDLINFGFQSEVMVEGLGINGKMNEIQSAIGLLQLKYIDLVIKKRKAITDIYRNSLYPYFKDINCVHYLDDIENVKHNYSYFPIFIDNTKHFCTRDALYNKLKRNNIFGRRYFYPLISQFDEYVNLFSATPGNLPVAESMSKSVICLPIYSELNCNKVLEIVNLIREYL